MTTPPIPLEKSFVGHSKNIKEVREQIQLLSPLDSTVLISGGTGTGKSLAAEMIYAADPRKPVYLVKISPSQLFDNSLVSIISREISLRAENNVLHQNRPYLYVIIEDVHNLKQTSQVELIDILDNENINSFFKNMTIRLIATINNGKKINTKILDELYFRLCEYEIKLEALSNRQEDLEPLTLHFISHYRNKLECNVEVISENAYQILSCQDWPGNLWELKNLMHKILLNSSKTFIGAKDINRYLENQPAADDDLSDDLQILEALKMAGGNKSLAARLLGVSRRTIYRKIEMYNINYSLFSSPPEEHTTDSLPTESLSEEGMCPNALIVENQ